MADQHHIDLVQSFTRVRLALGFLGLMLPAILILGGILDQPRIDVATGRIEPTISDFYHTTYRDIFVGTLCAIGVFLVSYRGYRRGPGEWINDDWLATLAGLAAFGLAFFPNEGGGEAVVSMTQHLIGVHLTPVLHYSFALVFFVCLATFCLYKFPKTSRPWRRRIYIRCGQIIVVALVLTTIAVFFKRVVGGPIGAFVLDHSLIFWFEAIGVWAFAISWIVKSKADLALVEKVAGKKLVEPQKDSIAQ